MRSNFSRKNFSFRDILFKSPWLRSGFSENVFPANVSIFLRIRLEKCAFNMSLLLSIGRLFLSVKFSDVFFIVYLEQRLWRREPLAYTNFTQCTYSSLGLKGCYGIVIDINYRQHLLWTQSIVASFGVSYCSQKNLQVFFSVLYNFFPTHRSISDIKRSLSFVCLESSPKSQPSNQSEINRQDNFASEN